MAAAYVYLNYFCFCFCYGVEMHFIATAALPPHDTNPLSWPPMAQTHAELKSQPHYRQGHDFFHLHY